MNIQCPFQEDLKVESVYGLLICSTCQYSLSHTNAVNVQNHFKTKHGFRPCLAVALQIEQWHRNVVEGLQVMPLPPLLPTAIPLIPVKPGYACLHCNDCVRQGLSSIKAHLGTVHKLQRRLAIQYISEEIQTQKVNRHLILKVAQDVLPPQQQPPVVAEAVTSVLETIRSNMVQQQNVVVASKEVRHHNAWVNATGFMIFRQTANIAQCQLLTNGQANGPEELLLEELADQLLQDLHVRVSEYSFQLKCQVKQWEESQYGRCFRQVEQQMTLDQYKKRFTRLLLFLVRACRMELPFTTEWHQLNIVTAQQPTAQMVKELAKLVALQTGNVATRQDYYYAMSFIKYASVTAAGQMTSAQTTTLLAGIIYCQRLVLLDAIADEHVPQRQQLLLELPKRLSYSGLATMVGYFNLAKTHLSKEHQGSLAVTWLNDDKTTLLVKQFEISLSMLQSCKLRLEQEIRQQFFLVNAGLELDLVELDQVTDQLNLPQSLFVQQHNYNLFHDRCRQLGQHLLATKGYADNVTGTINAAKVQLFANRCRAVEELMQTLLQVSSGAPCRAETMASLSFHSTEASTRNFYFHRGKVMIQHRYDKPRSLVQSDSNVVRFLDASSSQLVLQYYGVYRPILVALLEKMDLDTSQLKVYLFCRQRRVLTGDEVRSSLKNCMSRCANLAIGVQAFRQAVSAFLKAHVRDLPLSLKLPIEDQAGHAEELGDIIYGRGVEELVELPESRILDFYAVSTKWQELLSRQE